MPAESPPACAAGAKPAAAAMLPASGVEAVPGRAPSREGIVGTSTLALAMAVAVAVVLAELVAAGRFCAPPSQLLGLWQLLQSCVALLPELWSVGRVCRFVTP